MELSVFEGVDRPKPSSTIDIDLFLYGIKTGAYKTQVECVRQAIAAGKNKLEIASLKKKIQCVTISGTFSYRAAANLINHSGFICIDSDDIKDLDEVRSRVYTDQYLFAGLESVSGTGLALIFKIKGEKHGEMFDSLSDYLYNKYDIIADVACRDVSRLRIASYDPQMYVNKKAHLYNIPLKKDPIRKIPKFMHVRNDFERIVSIISDRQIDITYDYRNWLRIGFGIADTYGEEGREYFHQISQVSAKYTYEKCEKQYNNCLRARGTTKATLATLYYLAKEANIQIYSETTRAIASAATINKKERLPKEQSIQAIIEFGGYEKEEASEEQIAEIVSQVYDNDINFNSEKAPIEQFEEWLLKNYNLRYNNVTRNIECDGVEMDDVQYNDIFRKVKRILPKVTTEMIEKVINSNFVDRYNPFYDFYEKHKDRKPEGAIDALFSSIETKTGHNKGCYDFAQHFGKKWMVSMIASTYYKHSPLMLVLADGPQGIGKTEFFRRLLPEELHPYFAESKLDQGKDDDILMTKKLIIFDDEMSGKSKQDIRMLKTKTSVQEFTIREPYGRRSVTLQRLAVLCGSTNEAEVINDPTGNRRIIPIGTMSIDHHKYNSVDKIDLIMEAYHLYKSGYNYQLTKDDVELLNNSTSSFEMISPERESIMSYVKIAESIGGNAIFQTTTQIASYLKAKTNIQTLSLQRIGQELRSLSFKAIAKRMDDFPHPVKGYWVEYIENSVAYDEDDYKVQHVEDNDQNPDRHYASLSFTDAPF